MRQLDPRELFELHEDRPALHRPVLVQALDGFIDAGSGQRLVREHLLASSSPQPVATFDVDQLLDYRARRPPMTFAESRWQSYEQPRLAVYLLHDAVGTPYLLLAGPEPDVQWDRFVSALLLLHAELDVSLTVGFDAIPMAVPHTRPVGVISHATRRELLPLGQSWLSGVEVPATAGHLLEYRLGQAGRDAVGFAVPVPHYVAQAEYPPAAVVLLEEVARASGLALPPGDLEEAAAATRSSIDEQVAASTDIAAVVAALEQQYDAFLERRAASELDGGALPTADELGAQFEQFLSQHEPPRPG